MVKNLFLSVLCLLFSSAIAQDVTITQTVPASATAGQTIDVACTLSKGPNVGSFAKFQLDLPAGFKAEGGDTKGGNFTFENNRMKIVWVSLPGENNFNFSYKIIAPANASGDVKIAPEFFYLESNAKKQFNVPSSTISFGGSAVASNPPATDNTSAATPPANTPTEPAADNSSTDNTSTDNTTTEPVKTENVASSNPPAETNTQASTPPAEVKTSTPPPAETKTTPPANTAKTASSNRVYHVQLGAFTNKPNKAQFAQYGSVKIVEDQGMNKVLIGNFKTLEEARKYKSDLISKGVQGVFIVAYENGVRVKI